MFQIMKYILFKAHQETDISTVNDLDTKNVTKRHAKKAIFVKNLFACLLTAIS
jgi:hypothetical protein